MIVRPIQSSDLSFIREELVRHWADTSIWSIGRRYQADELPGLVAIDESNRDERVGLVTYFIHAGGWQGEVITLSSRAENTGAGTALLAAAVQAIRDAGCARAFLTTTNDNLRALGFYQKRGWRLAALHKGIIDEARKRVPAIPTIGMNGIPLRDEIELEIDLGNVIGASLAIRE
jgi:GNAT superfamily N-acetyltransferase